LSLKIVDIGAVNHAIIIFNTKHFQVLEHPSGEFFILENYEHTWRCLVPASRTLSSGGRRSDMELIFPMASSVHINAVLIDEKNPVQVS